MASVELNILLCLAHHFQICWLLCSLPASSCVKTSQVSFLSLDSTVSVSQNHSLALLAENKDIFVTVSENTVC